MKKLGIITVGQSPRSDIVAEMAPFFGKDIDIIERGALDGLSMTQIREFFSRKQDTAVLHEYAQWQ